MYHSIKSNSDQYTSIFGWNSCLRSVIITKYSATRKYLVATIGAQWYKILRNPLVAVFTFKINDATRQKNADEERNRKRDFEIQDALKRRKELRQQSQMMVSMAMESNQNQNPPKDEIFVIENSVELSKSTLNI